MLWETAAALSLPVFPCLPDKRPACTHGYKDAETDPRRVRDLFRSFPAATLIGVPTGEISGFDVLDSDAPRHPEAAQWLWSIDLPTTRAHKTQSGGTHYLFKHHPGLRNWSSRPVPGIDGRADGGYICHWPSAGCSINEAPIADWPRPLLELFQKPEPPPREPYNPETFSDASVTGVIAKLARAVNGERNNLLFWAACRGAEWVNAGEISPQTCESILLEAASRTGLDVASARRTIASGFRAAGN